MGEINHKVHGAEVKRAEIGKEAIMFWYWGTALTLVITVIGIAILPFWLIFAYPVCKHYRETYTVSLTERALVVHKGPACGSCVPHVEKNIPLDRIQDVMVRQDCFDRCFDVKKLQIQTAGGGAGPEGGPEVELVGVVDDYEFRDAIIEQREIYTMGKRDDGLGAARQQSTASPIDIEPAAAPATAVLEEIRDVMIEIRDDQRKLNEARA